MLQIRCWLDSEDYWNINSMNENNQALEYFCYKFLVDDAGQTEGSETVTLIVTELINAHLAIGFVVPTTLEISGDFEIGFICQEKPDEPIPLICKLSDEVKKTKYDGDELHRIE